MEPATSSAYDRTGKRKYLSRTEGQKFLEQALELPNLEALFCLTLYYTGCRITEALNICREDLDTEMSVLSIRTLKKRRRKEIRRIPVPEFLTHQLAEVGLANENRRFWTFSRTTAWRIVKRAMNRAGIFGIHATTRACTALS